MITQPGIYNLPAEEYHADPCPTPSLSAGMINDLLEAPAKCFQNSRRLNPDWQEDDKPEKFTIGTVSHVMFLEPELFADKVVVLPFDDWRKKEAKEARETARKGGMVAILAKHMDQVAAARAAFLAHGFVREAFSNGQSERSFFWRHPLCGFWCRARPDFVADAGTHLNDYKTTTNANPEKFGRHAFSLGYHRRAAWYLEGAGIVLGKRPDHYWFVNQETKAPYLTSVIELDWTSLQAAQDENDHAAAIFARCLERGEWYGYRDQDHLDTDRAFQVGIPPWAYAQIDERLRPALRAKPTLTATQPPDDWADEEAA